MFHRVLFEHALVEAQHAVHAGGEQQRVAAAAPEPAPAVERMAEGSGTPAAQTAAPAPESAAPVAAPPPVPRPAPAKAPAQQQQRSAASPSFNCSYARTRSERMVCGSGALAAKDRQMAAIYYAAMANGDVGVRNHLRRSRDAFLRQRERCSTEACVANAYAARVAEIRRLAGE